MNMTCLCTEMFHVEHPLGNVSLNVPRGTLLCFRPEEFDKTRDMFHVEHLSARAPALVPAKAEHHTLPTDGGLGLRIDCVCVQHGLISSAFVPLVTFLVHACYPAWFRVIECQ